MNCSVLAYYTHEYYDNKFKESLPLIITIIVIALIIYIIYLVIFKRKCMWCGRIFNRIDRDHFIYDGYYFCCVHCKQDYEERSAEISHKKKIAGKGKVNTRINDYTFRKRNKK